MSTASAAQSKRVAVVAACPYPTLQGSQVLVRQLTKGLAARGHRVVVVAYAEGLEDALDGIPVRRALRIPGVSARQSGPRASKVVLDLALLWTLIGVLRRERIELVHAHNYEGALVGLVASKLVGVPLIYHSHNALAEELPTYFHWRLTRWLARAFGAMVDRMVPRRADHCIAICRELVDFLRARGVEAGAIRMIAPGSSLEEFPLRSAAEVASIRERFGFGARPLLLYTGNLDGYQNVELLLASIARVRMSVPEALLVIATHASRRDLPAVLQRPMEGVELLRAAEFATIRDLLTVADVALLPRHEWSGFPMKLLNYMAAGKPVVVSAGSAKAIRHGLNGWVVPDGRPDAYARAIVDLLAAPRLRAALGAAARRTVEDEYGWDRVLDQVELTYQHVLDEHAAGARAVSRTVSGVVGTVRVP